MRLEGNPLAIELAAARLRILTIEQIVDRLDNLATLLSDGTIDGPTHHRTLESTLTWSYELLDTSERELLELASMFVGGFDLSAADFMSPTAAMTSIDVLDGIQTLVDSSLLQVEQSGDTARYKMLDTVRQYATKRLVNSGRHNDLARRFVDYYAGMMESAKLGGPAHIQWKTKIDVEYANIREALRLASGS